MMIVSPTPQVASAGRVSAVVSGGLRDRPGAPGWVQLVFWAILLTIVFFTYAGSFSNIPIIEEKHSVLADSDAANFALLVREFGFSKRFGDEYKTAQRTEGDVAQKHKIHHVLYAITASGIFTALQPLYRAVGLPADRAVYGVNALIGCLNIIVLALLIRRLNPNGNPIWPFLVLYAFTLNVWIYSAVPESWPFTSLLVMTFLLSLTRLKPFLAGALLGIFLLNNIFLSLMFIILSLEIARRSKSVQEWLRTSIVAGAIAVATWAVGMLALSSFDPSLSPVNFIRFTFWFRDYASPGRLPLYDPYVGMSVLSNTFVTSVVSNQPDAFVPQEAMLYTLQGGWLGRVATLSWLALAAVVLAPAMYRLARADRARMAAMVRDDHSWDLVVLCAVWAAFTWVVFYASGFLYSMAIVPLFAALLCRHLDFRRRTHMVLCLATVLLIVINNIDQITQFRATLGAMKL